MRSEPRTLTSLEDQLELIRLLRDQIDEVFWRLDEDRFGWVCFFLTHANIAIGQKLGDLGAVGREETDEDIAAHHQIITLADMYQEVTFDEYEMKGQDDPSLPF